MAKVKSKNESPLVSLPSDAYIPERDLDKLPVLEARHLGIDFGGLKAVDDFNLVIGRTEIAGLIGPNGAGKTTVFNLLTKVYQPTRGTIMVDGRDTSGMNTVQVNKLGVARTFQNIRLFSNLSVEDNVKLGLHNQIKYGMLGGMLRLPSYWKQERIAHERALELLSIFRTAQAGDSEGAGNEPEPAAAGRAGCGHEPLRDGRAYGEHHEDTRYLPDRHPANRARHESGHGHLRRHMRFEFRQGHSQGHAGGHTVEPRGH